MRTDLSHATHPEKGDAKFARARSVRKTSSVSMFLDDVPFSFCSATSNRTYRSRLDFGIWEGPGFDGTLSI
jgi:hypothetical protein